MDKNNLLIDNVTFGAAKTAAKKYADALNAYEDPNGNLTSVTLAAALTELAASAADILTQLNALDGSTDTRYSFSAFSALMQATLRSYESRITTLEAQVAAMA